MCSDLAMDGDQPALNNPEMAHKALIGLARKISPVWLACSGGIDSLWLLHFFQQIAKIKVQPVFFNHPGVYAQERVAALAAVKAGNGIVVNFSEKEMVAVWGAQQTDRCYRCKQHLFARLADLAEASVTLCDGSHLDDSPERRPGMRALNELGVISPLRLCGWNKEMIRKAARAAGLSAWNNPARACLVVDGKFVSGEDEQ
ncbi:MAG: hypothetical protein JXR80_11510 [Deltaproteobacteria bacterium]|nr:hypothetical protein [Deltaproteobacteria bacterium]